MKRYRQTRWSEGWSPVEIVTTHNGWLVEIGYNAEASLPCCVQYAGNGHYFKTFYEARAYCHGRGWMPHSEVYKEVPHDRL